MEQMLHWNFWGYVTQKRLAHQQKSFLASYRITSMSVSIRPIADVTFTSGNLIGDSILIEATYMDILKILVNNSMLVMILVLHLIYYLSLLVNSKWVLCAGVMRNQVFDTSSSLKTWNVLKKKFYVYKPTDSEFQLLTREKITAKASCSIHPHY